MTDSNSSLTLNRREFLRIIGTGAALTGVGAIIQACAPAPTPTAVPTAVPPTTTPTAAPLAASKEHAGENMYARVTTRVLRLEKLDEAIAYMRETLVPAAKQLDGSKGALSLLDRNTGKGILITLWATKDAHDVAYSNGSFTKILSYAVANFAATTPVTEKYEVVAQA